VKVFVKTQQCSEELLELFMILALLKCTECGCSHDDCKASRSPLELFRMKLSDHFTQLHLWPNCFDLSVESFTMKNNEQIGVGISPGDDDSESPYLYVNPYPFDEKMVDPSLGIGKWHTTGWNGIKVEWNELEDKIEQEISSTIYDLFLVAKRNFR
jgi:hypothetical protein